jgi:hypothetical protein
VGGGPRGDTREARPDFLGVLEVSLPKPGRLDLCQAVSPEFWGVILGSVIGGACTLVGGFGGAWWLGRSERQADAERQAERERLDVTGAITITEYELIENVAWLKGRLLQAASGRPVPLSNAAYRSVQLLLARSLPGDTSTRLAKAYSMIQVAQEHIQHGIDSGGLSPNDIKELNEIKNEMDEARRVIGRYRETLAKP